MSRKAPAIVLGVTPGIQALSYVVLDVSGALPSSVDHDVLTGGRIKNKSLAELARKAYVHGMILGVVLERDPALALIIGPACNPKEPPEQVLAARAVLTGLATRFRLLVMDVTEADVQRALAPEAGVSLTRVLRRHLSVSMASHFVDDEEDDETIDLFGDRRVAMAAAVALTGYRRLKGL